MLGTSRKCFLGRITGRDVAERVPGTLATNVLALERGARSSASTTSPPARDALAGGGCYVGAPMARDDADDYDDDDD